MMEEIGSQIVKLVNIIYTPDQKDFDKEFIVFLDLMDVYLTKQAENEQLMKMLMTLQEAYIKKDYVEIADVLLYEIKEIL